MAVMAWGSWFGKPAAQGAASSADPTSSAKTSSGKASRSGNDTREVIESIAFAFILAFILRTFLAEAFVIPTGSMAPTLYGRCKEVTCSQCKHRFAIGASDELDRASGRL
jgi:signal peptidase I